MDYSFLEHFEYTSKNPYCKYLKEFDFVYQDKEGEVNKGLWKDVFCNDLPINLEIGSGYGEFMIWYTSKFRDTNFVGMEYRFKRCYQVAKKLAILENKNFRLLRAKGERIAYLFGEKEVNDLFYFFPDPWLKLRQKKRRLFQETFLERLANVVKGRIYIKTDNDDYFKNMLEVACKYFEIEYHTDNLRQCEGPRVLKDFSTKFETIFVAKNINIKAMVLKNVNFAR